MRDEKEDEIKVSRNMLKIMSVESRIAVLKALELRQMTASELARFLNKHVTTVSFHLDKLTKAGLTERVERPDRKWVYYKITKHGKKILHPQPYTRITLLFSIAVIIITGLFILSYYYLIFSPQIPPRDISLEEAMNDMEILGREPIDVPTDVEIEIGDLSEESLVLTL